MRVWQVEEVFRCSCSTRGCLVTTKIRRLSIVLQRMRDGNVSCHFLTVIKLNTTEGWYFILASNQKLEHWEVEFFFPTCMTWCNAACTLHCWTGPSNNYIVFNTSSWQSISASCSHLASTVFFYWQAWEKSNGHIDGSDEGRTEMMRAEPVISYLSWPDLVAGDDQSS